MKKNICSQLFKVVTAIGFFACFDICAVYAVNDQQDVIKRIVDAQIRPEMNKMHIPGMAVGIALNGNEYVFNYGVASKANQKLVTDSTLFEIGSISKTFTATLASYAQIDDKLSLSDKTSKFLPYCKNTPFGNLKLLNLGTHTPGGLPLQLPPTITNNDQLQEFLKQWKPSCEAGKFRTYNNPGIGMLGLIAAQSLNQEFDVLMEKRIFAALGMNNSYINVPESQMMNYAQGYTEGGLPSRVTKALLADEAYGVKTTATDLLRFVKANMNMIKVDEKVQRAIMATHTGYFKVGGMTQDLIWEQYHYPVALKTLLEGNSSAMIFQANKVSDITPPQAPLEDVWINKTGSTNGCSAYIAYIPKKKIGIVMLANKSYPIRDRVTIAHQILQGLKSN
ncbi:MAG: beta-lactamase [Candidatus Obscuribacterales bacterium]|nr:beta-lactamase [Candidatus Obscuribacterales bacterium]